VVLTHILFISVTVYHQREPPHFRMMGHTPGLQDNFIYSSRGQVKPAFGHQTTQVG